MEENVGDATYQTEHAILAPHNVDVDAINKYALSKFPGLEVVALSSDELAHEEDAGRFALEYVHSLNPTSLPPHILRLKVSKCASLLLLHICSTCAYSILISHSSSWDAPNGDQEHSTWKLCNGTCVILREVKCHLIKCEIAVGGNKGAIVYIPRVGLEPSASDSNGLLFKCTQFPVKPAFAMTVNKAQGQSLSCVGLYLWDSVFTHGQLYVALSQASSFAGIHIVARYDRKKKQHTT